MCIVCVVCVMSCVRRAGWAPVGYFFRPRHSEALREKVEVFALAEKVPNGTYLRPVRPPPTLLFFRCCTTGQ